MLRIGKNLARRPGFDDLAVLHDADMVGHVPHDAEVMGDEQHGHAHFALQFLQQLQNLRLHRDVERGRRFIGDEQVGIVGKRHGDHHALALAARKLMRKILKPRFRDRGCPLSSEARSPSGVPWRRADALVDFEDFADLPLDRVQAG